MAAPNQPNSVPPNQANHKIGSDSDLVVSLGNMIAVKDIDPDNRTCWICTEPYVDNSPSGENTPVKLGCGHIFDLGCLLRWLFMQEDGSQRDTCPLCLKPLLHNSQPEQQLNVGLRQFPVAAFPVAAQINQERINQQRINQQRIDQQRIDQQRLEEENLREGFAVAFALFCLMNYFPRTSRWVVVVEVCRAVIKLFCASGQDNGMA